MSIESQWVVDKTKANHALAIAKQKNASKVVPIKANSYTTIFVTKEQSEDSKFITRMKQSINEQRFFFEN